MSFPLIDFAGANGNNMNTTYRMIIYKSGEPFVDVTDISWKSLFSVIKKVHMKVDSDLYSFKIYMDKT